ncbi:DsbE family thiol:disulfide interchange protein [Noviherbaspirillum sedimenti]|uniref:DsbE family thiol:disulfide interchange protein n=2 Tax=Noviherbaspirillum sedimenti TaxID=2320865 RepID=A0A3A3G3G5_9BURK|nr:DsbE family thiol:disulfide interchange protein [Noviherbaspirillum sedimenti]
MRRFVPAAIFIAFLLLLALGLAPRSRDLPSSLIGKSAPAFSLPLLDAPQQTLTPADLRGRVWVLNVWASWCGACREEHPILMQLSRTARTPIYGLDYKDGREDASAWLTRHGNPYRSSLFDADGRVGIDYGVYGVPETFVIDRRGVVRHKHVGPLTEEFVRNKLLPMLVALENEPQAARANSETGG